MHDIDLKDAKFGREEMAGIAGLIGGIVLAHSDDEQRLARGAAIFDDLYRHFRNKKRVSKARNVGDGSSQRATSRTLGIARA